MDTERQQGICRVWCFRDGKPGHENQINGLLQALERRLDLELYEPPLAGGVRSILYLLVKSFPAPADPAPPDLLIGAGHATHLPMLAARRACGGRAIVLMQPSLPLACFDLCIIPEHDHPPPAANVLATKGVLNHIRHTARHDPARGLFLIGGPSSHVQWDSGRVAAQVARIVAATPGVRWWLTTSRRTPDDFAGLLAQQLDGDADRVDVVPVSETGRGWVPDRLEQAATVWVTEDSVSMVYEALSSGAAVGLLEVPARGRGSRVSRGVAALRGEGWLTGFSDWEPGRVLRPPGRVFDEAERCADWIRENLLV